MEKKDEYDGKSYSQEDIDKVWEEVWIREVPENESGLFGGFLFKSGIKTYNKYFPNDQSITFLEIGAGSGRYGLAFAKSFTKSQVTLTDSVSTSIELIKSLVKKLQLKNVFVETADATSLKYQDKTFDIVFADGVIQHIIDVETAMREMVRVLKPGGVLIVSAVNSHNPPHAFYKWWKRLRNEDYDYGYERTYKPNELKKIFENNGLQSVTTDGFATAYGLIRLKRYRNILGRLGGYLNYLVKIMDNLSGRRFTKNYGFMIFAVGKK